MKLVLHVLRAKIKGFASESQSIRRQINASKGEKRHALWMLKHEIGFQARMHLLAYALLRGKKFSSVERKGCFENIGSLERILGEHGRFTPVFFTREKIFAWMDEVPSVTEQDTPKSSCDEQMVSV